MAPAECRAVLSDLRGSFGALGESGAEVPELLLDARIVGIGVCLCGTGAVVELSGQPVEFGGEDDAQGGLQAVFAGVGALNRPNPGRSWSA